MKRIKEIILSIVELYPQDEFFKGIFEEIETNEVIRKEYLEINDYLMRLDDTAWLKLKSKAINKFAGFKIGNWKQAFFNTLNEAKAYCLLSDNSCQTIAFIDEENEKTPDLKAKLDSKDVLCEAKTINISDKEIVRRMCQEVHSGYFLNNNFFEKLDGTIKNAEVQLNWNSKQNNIKIVFIEINFDDLFAKYSEEYKRQILEYLSQHKYGSIVYISNWNYQTRNMKEEVA